MPNTIKSSGKTQLPNPFQSQKLPNGQRVTIVQRDVHQRALDAANKVVASSIRDNLAAITSKK